MVHVHFMRISKGGFCTVLVKSGGGGGPCPLFLGLWKWRAHVEQQKGVARRALAILCEVTPFRLLVLLSFFSPDPVKASYEATGTTCLCTHDYSSLLRVVQPLVELW